MLKQRITRAARLCAAALLLAATAVPVLGGVASGETPEDLKARIAAIQADLDATTRKVDELHAEEERLETRLGDIESDIAALEKREEKLSVVVARRANELYRAGSMDLVEVLIDSESIAELSSRAEILSQISVDDANAFVQMARTKAELEHLTEELSETRAGLEDAEEQYLAEHERLQSQFDSVSAELARLQEQLAAAQPSTAVAAPPVSPGAPSIPSVNGKACPIGQPHSFIDSWGYPRSGGRTHEGVDMMAGYGTPVYAIVSGSITYAGYGDSAGNWQILSGSDGNAYWYMHNQSNIVTGGGVKAGQQIATVGDTGNAAGAPHLHFEYHPGGGGPVNPYPLVAAIC